MKKTAACMAAAAAAALILATPAAAAEKAADKPAKEETKPAAEGSHSQQNRMKTCNAEAARKQLKGDERRAFMSSCLKG